MISKSQLRASLIVLSITFFMSQGCAGIAPTLTPPSTVTHTVMLTKTNTPQLTITPAFTSTSIIIATAVPLGVFALLIYPPLIVNYDASVWKDESYYSEVSLKPAYSILNYLQSLSLETCQIGIQGPTGDFPFTPEVVQLASVRYEVITFTDSPPGSITTYYIENKSLAGFNYEMGTSVLVVQASLTEWNECKTLAEKVLSTLRVP